MSSRILPLAVLVITAATAMAPVSAQDNPAATLARKFGAREQVRQISLSPDGGKAAIVTATSGATASVLVADFKDGSTRSILTSSGIKEQVTSCNWATDARLVCNLYLIIPDDQNRLLGYSRAVVMDADGRNATLLSTRTTARSLSVMQGGGRIIDWAGDGKGSVLMTRQFVPEETSVATGIRDDRDGLGLDLVDIVSLERKTVEKPRPDTVEFITDGRGTVRIMGARPRTTDYNGDRIAYFYRSKGSRDWRALSSVVADGVGRGGFDPYAVDSDLDVAYGFDVKDGRQALYRLHLDGSDRRELVLGHDTVDVDGLVRIGRQRRVVGASYATDRRQVEFFDPALAKLQTALGKAVPNSEQLAFVDASADEKKLLVYTGSDIDPGRYWLYDRDTKRLASVLPVRPALDGMKLAIVKSIAFKAADGTTIPGYLTLPPGSDGRGLPAIVMPHGGPGARDEWGFDWLAQFYAARGFAVLQPNFRGSAGFGDNWFLKNGFQSWRIAIGDVNDAGRYLVSSGIAAPGKLAIVGWSYGGYAALQSAVLDPDLFKAIVAIAPVTDLAQLREDSRDFANFTQVTRFIGSGPEVRAGSPAQNVARIKAPVLMFHGGRDQNVAIAQSRLMRGKLKDAGKSVILHEYPMLDHQLDDSKVRAELLETSDGFIRTALGL